VEDLVAAPGEGPRELCRERVPEVVADNDPHPVRLALVGREPVTMWQVF
jgi:hypothetical protein